MSGPVTNSVHFGKDLRPKTGPIPGFAEKAERFSEIHGSDAFQFLRRDLGDKPADPTAAILSYARDLSVVAG